jgi:hypothetical protein
MWVAIAVGLDENDYEINAEVYRLGLSGHGFATQAASFMVAA